MYYQAKQLQHGELPGILFSVLRNLHKCHHTEIVFTKLVQIRTVQADELHTVSYTRSIMPVTLFQQNC